MVNILKDDQDPLFADRLAAAIGGRYDPAMRRSVQTVVLYEANRILQDKYDGLRPFQRKSILYDKCTELLNSLDFIPEYLRGEILYRTVTGKVPLSPELVWRRMKVIDKEISKSILSAITPFLKEGKNHNDVCEDFIQHQYETLSGVQGKFHPALWEYGHLNIFLAYRMYYKGDSIDTDLPPVESPKEIVVPTERPEELKPQTNKKKSTQKGGPKKKKLHQGGEGPPIIEMKPEERVSLLKEVRLYLDVLCDFKGVVPQWELDEIKKELFECLPPLPPTGSESSGGKRPSADTDQDDEAPEAKRVKKDGPESIEVVDL